MRLLCLTNGIGLKRSGGPAQTSAGEKSEPPLRGAPMGLASSLYGEALKKLILGSSIIISARSALRATVSA